MNGTCRTLPILRPSCRRDVGSWMNSSNVSATACEREENASQALGEGAGPGPSQNSLSNKGLIQGRGAELGSSETSYGSGNGSACPEGPTGLQETTAEALLAAGGARVWRWGPFSAQGGSEDLACSALRL